MRLIDADKLIQKFKKKNQTLYTDEYEEGRNVGISWCTEDVVNAPTVKAIPVEWIEKWLDQLLEEYKNTDYLAILYMLEEWKSGNE